MKNIEDKREYEKKILGQMISLYCRKNHKSNKASLCDDCSQLFDYAKGRIDNCPYITSKSFCSNCASPCYKSPMREKIKSIMRFSGPRMLFVNPVVAIKHLIQTKPFKKGPY